MKNIKIMTKKILDYRVIKYSTSEPIHRIENNGTHVSKDVNVKERHLDLFRKDKLILHEIDKELAMLLKVILYQKERMYDAVKVEKLNAINDKFKLLNKSSFILPFKFDNIETKDDKIKFLSDFANFQGTAWRAIKRTTLYIENNSKDIDIIYDEKLTFEEEVRLFLNKGYQLQGDIVVSNDFIYQALVKYES